MVVLAAYGDPNKLKQQNTNRSFMIKPAPGPKSDFYRDLLPTKSDSIYRNTATHWHLHWYMITRGRPLLRLTAAADLVKQALGEVTQHLPVSQRRKRREGIAGRTLDNFQELIARRRWHKAFEFSVDNSDEDGQPQVNHAEGLRARIWNACENHPVINTILMLVILLSTVSDIVETETKVAGPPESPANVAMGNIDVVCIVIFTIEFVTRLICCPSLRAFARNIMNWIDLLAILPSYVSWIVVAAAAGGSADGILQVCICHRVASHHGFCSSPFR
jgi:hypothetical protein